MSNGQQEFKYSVYLFIPWSKSLGKGDGKGEKDKVGNMRRLEHAFFSDST